MLKTPPLQTATATIDTLCGRLQSATLLEDRRAAILGLRSFAKQYPASVASGSLRELIATLRRDGLGEKGDNQDGSGRRSEEGTGDVDTIRLVLETLLMLFNPDAGSPEAGDEIAFFMADGFSMRQDNITLLLNLLDPASPYADYYSRLYSVQILSAVCAARPERLQECILSAPLGVSRLVGVLDDGRDAVRNAGLLLLVDLTSAANEDLRKIVAFEDVFGKVFALINLEGGLAEAGITAQDCLSLLANLVKGSASNQTMFRESGCVAQLNQLLQQSFPSASEAAFLVQSREKSAFGLLQLLRLFLEPGESSTAQNQQSFFRAGTAQTLIELGFSTALSAPIRIAALKCAASLIANNPPLQEAFAALTVIALADAEPETTPAPKQTNGTRSAGPSNQGSARASAEKPRTYIIEALLDQALDRAQDEVVLRSAACGVIQAYLTGHERVKAHFLQRAIFGHAQQESAANVLTTLAQPSGDATALILASAIVQDLVVYDIDAKTALTAVVEGNENEGEDVLSFIQTLGSELEAALQQNADERVVAAYTGLLTVLLWEFASGVDDLLAEGSSLLQALAAAPKVASPDPLVAGLSVTLLGTIYEFSTKDSPIPRRTLAPLLTQKLGRSKYLEALSDLRRQPAVRDIDLSEEEDSDSVLCKTFVDLFAIEYSRLRRAIDKDPGIEVLPTSAVEAGVDRDVLDDLRQQLQTMNDALSQAQAEGVETGQRHEQERLSGQKELQTANAEVDRLRRINQAMQQGHESELEELAAEHEQRTQGLSSEHEQALAGLRQDTQRQTQAAVRETEVSFTAKLREYERRIAELGNAHRAEQTGHASARQQLEALSARHSDTAKREKSLSEQFEVLKQLAGRLEKERREVQELNETQADELEQNHMQAAQQSSELERLSTQVSELQEELKGREEELATERAGFADLEKELEAAKSAALPNPGGVPDGDESERVAKLEAELKEARDGEKSVQEELDGMLLVMSDIEAKRDEYRAKVKELGGEVSADEDEDGDEEDEGGEEAGEDDVK